MVTIIDEASSECLALIVACRLKHEDALAGLAKRLSREVRQPI